MKVDMMVQRFIAVLLMVALVGLVRAEDVKEEVVASAKGLKDQGKEDHLEEG
ncbi:MAG: hypothetical protein JKY75_08105 [Erythrobacter sp.]|nr:hypothetical protein [Erythrobacter sp.]